MNPLTLLATATARYDGEDVTQLQHALQAAALARHEGATDALCVAALLHDVGHLRLPDAGTLSQQGVDAHHERIGALLLSRSFGPEVVEPVRLHVAAKRCLARDAAYRASLSPESTRSLALQGGPFSDAEAAAFLALPFAADALRLRAWDDRAKDPDARVPDLHAWASVVDRLRVHAT